MKEIVYNSILNLYKWKEDFYLFIYKFSTHNCFFLNLKYDSLQSI